MKPLYKGAGGTVVLPKMVFLDRTDGGHLIINPPKIDVLPQLAGGCVNYFEAGNWALNDTAPPKGKKKRALDHRRVHMHVFGRSPNAKHPSWRWGEAPRLPLTAAECESIVKQAAQILKRRYA